MTDCATLVLLAPAGPRPGLLERFVEAVQDVLGEQGWARSDAGADTPGRTPEVTVLLGELRAAGTEVLVLTRSSPASQGEHLGATRAVVADVPPSVLVQTTWESTLRETGWVGLRAWLDTQPSDAPASGQLPEWRHEDVGLRVAEALGPDAVTVVACRSPRLTELAAATEVLLGLAHGVLSERGTALPRNLTADEIALLEAAAGRVEAGDPDPRASLELLGRGAVTELLGHEGDVSEQRPLGSAASRAPAQGRVPVETAARAAIGVLAPLVAEAEAARRDGTAVPVPIPDNVELQSARDELERLRAELEARRHRPDNAEAMPLGRLLGQLLRSLLGRGPVKRSGKGARR